MSGEHPELDQLQASYKEAVDVWISSIRKEEALASVNHSVADLDQREKAHFEEDEMRRHGQGREGKVRRRIAR